MTGLQAIPAEILLPATNSPTAQTPSGAAREDCHMTVM